MSVNQVVTSYILKLPLSFYQAVFLQEQKVKTKRLKRAFKVKLKAFVIISKDHPAAKTCLRPESASLSK